MDQFLENHPVPSFLEDCRTYLKSLKGQLKVEKANPTTCPGPPTSGYGLFRQTPTRPHPIFPGIPFQGTPQVVVQTPAVQPNLPQISLPTFNGEPSNWPGFWDRFSYSVHDRPDNEVSPVAKFIYLLESLTGRALTLVAGLPTEGGSYSEAIAKLRAEFGNPSVILDSLYHRLQSVPELGIWLIYVDLLTKSTLSVPS
uniref:Uncharacterized protein n=1 Tax=Ditylenchus dipsaci TaxID=166011 RepID=A0A915D3B7_9BILA